MAEFSWASAADVGFGLLQGALKQQAGSEIAEAQNASRASKNAVKKSQLTLAATVRDINNKRAIENASKTQDAVGRNTLRTVDSFSRGNFEASIKDAESIGHARAAAAASGLGGSGIEALSQVTSLAIARQNQLRSENQGNILFEGQEQMKSILPNALRAQDLTPAIVSNDLTRNSASGSMQAYLIQGLLSKKDSLQTLLGSLAPAPAGAAPNPASVPVEDRAISYAVAPNDGAQPATLSFDTADTYAVSQSQITGTPLAPITLK